MADTDPFMLSWENADVQAARNDFMNTITRLGGKDFMACTNYYDQMCIKCVVHLSGKKALSVGAVNEMCDKYTALMEALQPFQPTAEDREMAYSAPTPPWGTPKPTEGQVFYFLPTSGGYWVRVALAMAHILDGIRDRVGSPRGHYWVLALALIALLALIARLALELIRPLHMNIS